MTKRVSTFNIKFILNFSLTLLSVAGILFISQYFLKRNLDNNYLQNKKNLIELYSQTLELRLSDYKTFLDTFFDKELFYSGSVQEIHKYLMENHKNLPPNIQGLAYITTEGKSYISSGEILQVTNGNHYKKISTSSKDYFFTGTLNLIEEGEQHFLICKNIFDRQHNFKAALAMAVNFSVVENIVKTLETMIDSSFYLIGADGKILINDNPQESIYEHIICETKKPVSFDDLKNKGSGVIPVKNLNNKKEDIIFDTLLEEDWIIAVCIDTRKSFYGNIVGQKAFSTFLLAVLFIITIITFGEIHLYKYLEERKIVENEIDPLTGLWVRQYFENKASKILKNSKDIYMFIDADIRGYKFINTNYGLEEGNELLVFFANNIKTFVKQFNCILGRGFADHFYILAKVSSVNNGMKVFKSQLELFNKKNNQYKIPFFPKFGIVFINSASEKANQNTIQTLIAQASFAKNTIKDNLLLQYAIFNAKLLKKINEQNYIENNFKKALNNKEFFVVYQPKISLITNKIVGAEALVRWKNKEFGFMYPDKFIPILEQNDYIKELDFYVYEETLKFMRKLMDNNIPIVPFSMNMSRNHNKPNKFIHDLKILMDKYQISPEYIQMELIERTYIDNNILKELTDALHKEGISVAMDDFGSGESSLNILTKIPIDVIKFDREFLLSSTDENGDLSEKSSKFIEILINLSKHLEKISIFEGVETQDQIDFLKSIKCDQVQGYFYSRPLEEDAFINFLKNNI